MSAQLQISVLGPVRAWSGGRPLHLGTARQRAVLAGLVAAANRIITAQELIAAVWGASPPAAARGNLYGYISGLRRALPTGLLESQPTGYRLRLEEDARDSDRFVTMVAQAAELQEAGDDAGAATLLGDALSMWHGEAYAGLEGNPFEVQRAHLARVRLDATERRAGILLEQGDDGLVAELSGLVHEHPLHEPLYELLMRALNRAGRPAEALEVFRKARAVLVAELGVEPGATLRTLHRQILEGPPEPDRPSWTRLSDQTKDVLRLAVLLGPEFRADALIAVTGRPPLDVLAELEEALAATVLREAGAGLAFHDPLLARAVYDSMSAPVRARRRRRVAGVLAGHGFPAVEVAAQLTAETLPADSWMVSWTVEHLPELSDQAPQIAARLSRLLLQSPLPTDRQREALLVAYVQSCFQAGGRPGHEAHEALGLATDAAHRAEMRQILATLQIRDGDLTQAAARLEEALADQRTPPIWRTRHRLLLTRVSRAGDPYDATSAVQAQWLTASIRRDHDTALRHADRALGRLGSHTSFADLHLDLLDNRIFSLQNLDRLEEAEQSLHEATLVGIRHRLSAPLAVTFAVQYYWTGRWDEAIAQISAVTDDAPSVGLLGMREQRAGALLLHGVAALIAVHRDDPGRAAAHLSRDAFTDAERESSDFLLVARALLAEQQGRLQDCIDTFTPMLDPGYAPMLLRHQWVPDLLRSARRAGRPDIAERAAELCVVEAAKESTPARAAAALGRCQTLISGDPGPALGAAEHYRSVGRVPERAAALEDVAVVLAGRGHDVDAARYAQEATALYRSIAARWDLRRLRSRLIAAEPRRPRD